MQRLPITLMTGFTAIIAIHFSLEYFGFAILLGVVLSLGALFFHDDSFMYVAASYVCAFIGFAILIIAYLICQSYEISFEILHENRSIPRLIRRLPFFGIVLLTAGVTNFAISIFKKGTD